jgi:hypothetical protein
MVIVSANFHNRFGPTRHAACGLSELTLAHGRDALKSRRGRTMRWRDSSAAFNIPSDTPLFISA